VVGKQRLSSVVRPIVGLLFLYLFLVGIRLIGHSFSLFGHDFYEQLINIYSNPFAGLFTGILVTSIIQSSSTTTSLVVGLAGSGVITIESAVPIIMGANMGTTVTSTLVSLSFLTRKEDFRRAFSAATMHDFFNMFTIIIFFPLEITFHIIQKSATFFTELFQGVGGVTLVSPLKYLIDPVVQSITDILLRIPRIPETAVGIILLVLSLIMIVITLVYLVKLLRSMIVNQAENMIERYLFKNTFTAFLLGLLLTAIIQSSSVTISLVVPLVAAGLLNIKLAYPFVLGANIGTTVTAILASLAVMSEGGVEGVGIAGLTVAFCHLLFNLFGVIVFLPLKRIPLFCATHLADLASKSRIWAFVFVACIFFLIPLLLVFITR